jgi:alpha-tubulin suppressor-like RCC1 family protein
MPATNKGPFTIQEVRDQTLDGAWSYTAPGDIPGTFLYTAGSNAYGGLGDNSTIKKSSPVLIPGTTWTQYARGAHSSIAIKSDGTLWSWGYPPGNGNAAFMSSPVQVPGTTWCRIPRNSSGTSRLFAIKTDNTLWSWGTGGSAYLLPLNSSSACNTSSPIQIPGTTWCDVSISNNSGAAVKTDGTLWSWGYKSLATSGTPQSSPIQVPGTTWCRVTVAANAVYAQKTNGTLWAWGANYAGGLGQNTGGSGIDASSPVQIPGTTWCLVSSGYGAIAMKTDNTLWAWGTGDIGANGQNAAVNISSPTQIPGTWCTAGRAYSGMAIKASCDAFVWGRNADGQLGINSTVARSSPIQLPGTWKCVFPGFTGSGFFK